MHIANAASCVCVIVYCVIGYWDYCLTSDMYFCHSILIDVSQEWWHPIFFSDSCSNFKPLKANMETLLSYNIFSTLYYSLIFHPRKMELTLLIQFIENLCTPTRRFCFPQRSVPPIPFDPCACQCSWY
uniref:Uncharacterized protein n=1 Tax=Triticum urartu TaxID=4572 RepID=A0A8R7JX48_TRIUA